MVAFFDFEQAQPGQRSPDTDYQFEVGPFPALRLNDFQMFHLHNEICARTFN